MKHFFSRSAKVYTLDGQWVANATEVSGGYGEATMYLDMIRAGFDFAEVVTNGPELKIICELEDPYLGFYTYKTDGTYLGPPRDKIIMTGLKFFSYSYARDTLDYITRDTDFRYTQFEIHREGIFDLDALKEEYDVD
jgi:hypothetical protein